jgi:cytochrome c-type biogenesis protein CcmH/NrfG
MSGSTNALSGYVKTSNMYLFVLVALAAGFLGGVVFTSYRTSSVASVPGNPGLAGTTPISQEQSQALAALLQATRTTPDNVNAWTQLGHLYFDTEQYEKAIQAYEKSLELAPSRPDVWTDLGVMYRRAGNPKRAVECFDRALSIDAGHETALFNKGVVLMHDIKDAPAALQAWEKLIQINPDAQTPDGRPVKSMVEHFRNANPS